MEQNETNYIYMLYKNNLIREMEQEFEKQFPATKVSFSINDRQTIITLFIFDRTFKFIKSYIATEFDCKPESQDMLDYRCKEYPKSPVTILDDYVRKFYLRFLKNHFENYKMAYKIHLEKQADIDLGETTVF